MTKRVIPLSALWLVVALSAWPSVLLSDPPEGWQDRILPGFTPSLESVLLDNYKKYYFYYAIPPDPMKEKWTAWGPGAVDGFLKIYHDPTWKDFRMTTLGILFLNPYPEARTKLEQEVRKAAAETKPDSHDSLHQFISMFARYFGESSMPLLKELAQSPNMDACEAAGCALASLATPESIAAARKVAAGLPENQRKSVEYTIDAAEGTLRSKEIMIK